MSSPEYQAQRCPAEVLVVHGPAGGVGKTTVALYLAYLYAFQGCPTVLVDLSQYGTLSPWLGLPRGTSGGLAALLAAPHSGDLVNVQRQLTPAPGAEEHLQLILSSGPAKMDGVRANAVDALLRQLAGAGQIVVVDTGSELTERTVGALTAATRIALTLSPLVTTGWECLDLLEILRSVYISRDRIGAVFNRVMTGGKSKFSLDEYQDALGLPVWGVIPEDDVLHAAPERGGPPSLSGNGRGLAAMRQLAQNLVPVFAPKELKKGWR